MRYFLMWMLGAVAFVGFGCVALYNATETWTMAMLGFTVIVLLVAVVGAIHSNSRAFYTGIAVFGWGYLFLTYAPMRDSVRDFALRPRPLAATDAVLDVIYETMQREITVSGTAQFRNRPKEGMQRFFSGPTGRAYQMPIRQLFRAMGHALFALVFAIIGGVVGQYFS